MYLTQRRNRQLRLLNQGFDSSIKKPTGCTLGSGFTTAKSIFFKKRERKEGKDGAVSVIFSSFQRKFFIELSITSIDLRRNIIFFFGWRLSWLSFMVDWFISDSLKKRYCDEQFYSNMQILPQLLKLTFTVYWLREHDVEHLENGITRVVLFMWLLICVNLTRLLNRLLMKTETGKKLNFRSA